MKLADNPYSSPGTKTQERVIRFRWFLWLVPVLWFTFLVDFGLGSGTVQDVIVRGRILTFDGRPLANEAVDVHLPATYGLSAIEAREPAQYGNRTRIGHVTTNANGEFSHSFGPLVYHIDFFFVPFTTEVPSKPPGLVFSVRVPRVSSEHYVVKAREGSYRVVSEELPGASPLRSLAVREELLEDGGPVALTAVVELSYESSVRSSENQVASN